MDQRDAQIIGAWPFAISCMTYVLAENLSSSSSEAGLSVHMLFVRSDNLWVILEIQPIEVLSLSVHSQISIRLGDKGRGEMEEEYCFQILDSISYISSVCFKPMAM